MSASRVDSTIRALIEKNAGTYGIDPDLLEALAIARSGGNPDAPTTLIPQPPSEFRTVSYAEPLANLREEGHPGVRSVTLRAGARVIYSVDVVRQFGVLSVDLRGIAPGGNLVVEVSSPNGFAFKQANGSADVSILVDNGPVYRLITGTYVIIVDAVTDTVFDLDFQTYGDPVWLQRFGITQVSLEQARSVGFTDTPAALTNPDVNLRVAAALLDRGRSVCPPGDTACVLGTFLGDSGAQASSLTTNVNAATSDIKGTNPGSVPTRGRGVQVVAREANAADYRSFATQQTSAAPGCAKGPMCEPILPFPLPPNPFYATFTIDFPELNFTLTPTRPQYVTWFEYTEHTQLYAEMSVRVFDPTWDLVEGSILGASGTFTPKQFTTMLVTFGYARRGDEEGPAVGPDALYSSNPKTMQLYDYEIQFMPHGVEMVLKARSIENQAHMVERRLTYNDDNPEDMLRTIYEGRYGMELCIERPAPVTKKGMINATYTPRIWTQYGISDIQFTHYNIIPQLVSDENENQSQYVTFYDNETNILHIHPYPFGAGPIVREYFYGRERAGAVLSWQPVVLASANLLQGGGRLVSQSLGVQSGEVEQVATDQYTAEAVYKSPDTAIPALVNPVVNFMSGTTVEDVAQRFVTKPGAHFLATASSVLNTNQFGEYNAMQATLQIIGDPLIRPFVNVYVEVMTRREPMNGGGNVISTVHPSSGEWMVRRVTHTIQGGEFITALTLLRSGPYQEDGYVPPPQPPAPENMKSAGYSYTMVGLNPWVLGDPLGGSGVPVGQPPTGGGGGGGGGDGRFFDPGPGYTKITNPVPALGTGWQGVGDLPVKDNGTYQLFYDLPEDATSLTFHKAYDGGPYGAKTDIKITPPPGTEGRYAGISTFTYSQFNYGDIVTYPRSSDGDVVPKGTYLIELKNTDIYRVGTGQPFADLQYSDTGAQCDVHFSKLNPTQLTASGNLPEGQDVIYCFTMGPKVALFFEISSINLSNAQASDLAWDVTSPSGVHYTSQGAQPGVAPLWEQGSWQIKMTLNDGYPRFTFNIRWSEQFSPIASDTVPTAHLIFGVKPAGAGSLVDRSTAAESSSLNLVDPVSGITNDGGRESIHLAAGEEQLFHFNPGSATRIALTLLPVNSTFDGEVEVRPPAVTGIGTRTVHGTGRVDMSLGNDTVSLNGTWRLKVTAHTDTTFTIFWRSSGGDTDLTTIAPDGSLDTFVNRNFGYGNEHVYIPNGLERKFYATVKPPQVPEGFVPKNITFSWEDESRSGLGSIFVTVEQLSGPKLVLDSGNASASGSIVFSSNRGTSLPYTPENVTLGYYIITLRGVASQAGGEYYKIHWNVS